MKIAYHLFEVESIKPNAVNHDWMGFSEIKLFNKYHIVSD